MALQMCRNGENKVMAMLTGDNHDWQDHMDRLSETAAAVPHQAPADERNTGPFSFPGGADERDTCLFLFQAGSQGSPASSVDPGQGIVSMLANDGGEDELLATA